MKIFILAFAVGIIFNSCSNESNALPKVIVTTDINIGSGDPDDRQSMAHLLMYANEVEIVSLIPDRENGIGIEPTMNTIDAYEEDYNHPDYNFQKLNYPEPDKLRGLVQTTISDGVESIIREAKKLENKPLHILVWGNMNVLKKALFKAPEIAENIRIYTIGTHRMAENLDAIENSRDTVMFGLRSNWNGRGRDAIYNDNRFNNLWWLENNWAYNGMFEREEPRKILLKIKKYGKLGNNIWEVVQAHEWARYFRAGDTPTLLYLLEPKVDIDDPTTSTWAGKFVKPYPEIRPNYWIDYAGIEDWNYANPEKTWENAKIVYNNRVQSIVSSRDNMYEAYKIKMEKLYNK